ncbi:hypothetical protein [Flavobacterium sp. HJSW_4]|uniref:hypothetical protein n=1 Tax=Flavobacterium sp. HJSW_4 TaxID=3344660 RepID=UPI0035F39BB8
MNSKSFLFPIIGIGILFSGCVEKGELRCILPATTVSSNSPIISNDPIILKTPKIEGATYHWTGPNGFESNVQNPTISNSTVDMSGEYKLVTSIGICKTEELTTEVTVIKNVTTCAINNYEMTFVNSPFTKQTFFPHYTDGHGTPENSYTLNAGNLDLNLNVFFKGNDIPKTGNYTIVNSATALSANTVHVDFNWHSILYYQAISGDVSVSFSNGKFMVTFCDVPFSNVKSTNNQKEFTASAKFTEH